VIKSTQDNRGFTLVEVMVAILITLVGLLGLLQSVNVATEHNLKNYMRDEAVQVGETVMNGMMVRPIGTPFAEYTLISSRIRSGTGKYNVKRTTVNMTGVNPPDSMLYTVRVAWAYKNITSTHEVQTVKAR
jgi:type IV pilus assembly protein PilV